MYVRHLMGVLHSFSIKNIFYDKMDFRLFYFHVTIWCLGCLEDMYYQQNETERKI